MGIIIHAFHVHNGPVAKGESEAERKKIVDGLNTEMYPMMELLNNNADTKPV